MIPHLKVAARMVLPLLSLGACLVAVNGDATNPGGSIPSAIVALVAFFWWREIGPQA